MGRYSNQREAAQKAEAEHVARRYEEQARAKEEREKLANILKGQAKSGNVPTLPGPTRETQSTGSQRIILRTLPLRDQAFLRAPTSVWSVPL